MTKKEEKTLEKEVQTVSVHVKFSAGLIEKVDQYQIDNHLNSRVSAMAELMRIGLGELERKK